MEEKIYIGTNNGAIAQGRNAVAVVEGQSAFRTGDTVELKSGSPLMTVTDVKSDMVHCTWFRGKENASGIFPAAALLPKKASWRKED